MGEDHRTYIPAAGHDWLLPLYDPLRHRPKLYFPYEHEVEDYRNHDGALLLDSLG